MPELATLEALRDLFWPVYLLALSAGALSFVLTRRFCLGRTVLALALASLAQSTWAGDSYLQPWQHLAIDLPVFVAVTMPPRHYWQTAMGGLVLAQLVLHGCWWLAPDLAQWHWLGCILIGFVKCAVLLLWSGGARVESVLGWLSRPVVRVVPAPPARQPAR